MGRPRVYANDAERQRAFRARRRLKATASGAPTPVELPGTVAEGAVPAIWDLMEEIWGTVPDEEVRKLPVDGATQHDHYLYGLPKRER